MEYGREQMGTPITVVHSFKIFKIWLCFYITYQPTFPVLELWPLMMLKAVGGTKP